jgi:2-methylcitrate dehydratase PrpD
VQVTALLAEFCCGLSVERMPRALLERTRLLLLDHIGNVVRARAEAAATPSLLAMVKSIGWQHGTSRVFGDAAAYGPAGAAFLNAALGHALDFDDTHAAATLHPGVCVIPAAIAAAEMVGASGADVLAGIVAGYEVACRTALALPAAEHYARGFHPTATCGVFGAAAAAGRVFKLTAPQIESAMGTALSQSGGTLQFLVDGAWTKPFQVGWASMAGLSAATLAAHGFKGASQALEGRHGFLQAYAPAPNPARVVQGLGETYELMATAVKPYPSCRYGHAGIDATISLQAEHCFRMEEVEEMIYGISNAGMLLVGEPAETKQNPMNIVGAQFSAPFVLATALATGKMTWDSYRNLGDPIIRELLPRVKCVHDAEIEAEFPANMSGKITIRARGREYVRTVIVPLGEPGNFLSEHALTAKYESLAKPSMGAHAQLLAAAALELDSLPLITDLTKLSSDYA